MRRPPAARLPRPGAVLSALLLCGALAGCGSSDPDYYTLKPWPGAAQPGAPASLEVRTPSVAGSLDRDYIVRDSRDYRIRLAGDAAWSEPLGDMIGGVLSQDLAQRLPGTSVFTATGAVSTEAQAVLELDVSQFAEDQAGAAEIVATLAVHRPDGGAGIVRTLHLTAPVRGSGTPALVAALSTLLGQVADEAARQVRGLGPLPVAIVATPDAAATPPG